MKIPDKNPSPQVVSIPAAPIFLTAGLLLSACATQPSNLSVQAQATDVGETLRATAFLPSPGRPGLREALPPYAPLNIIKKGWGYSMVRTEDGRLGEVPTEDIGPRTAMARSQSRCPSQWLPAKASSGSAWDTPRPSSKDLPVPLEPLPPSAPDVIDIPPVEPDLPSWDDAPGGM